MDTGQSAASSTGQVRPATPARLCAVLACHNRRGLTLACLRALLLSHEAAGGLAACTLSAVLVDDGSSDGTANAVREAFPWVTVIEADGSLYWCRAMHRALAHPLARAADFQLWLNDDTVLHPEALARLLRQEAALRAGAPDQPLIVVGCVGQGDQPSYGGRCAVSRWRRTHWPLVAPAAVAQAIHTMDGNLVLVNAAAARRVGNLDAAFEHAMGDHDYALRARALGVGVWLAPGVLGECATNPVRGTFNDPLLPLPARWRAMLAPKGLPWRSWWRFTRRHAGWAWPLYFAWPYVRVLLGWSPRGAQELSPSGAEKLKSRGARGW